MTRGSLALLLALAAPAAAWAQAPSADMLLRPGGQFTTGSFSFRTRTVDFPAVPASFRAEPIATVVQTAEEPLRIRIGSDFLFAPGSADLRPGADGVLRDVLRQAKAMVPRFGLAIESYADASGDDGVRLAQARAETVRGWFTRDGGLAPRAIKVTGMGAGSPLMPELRSDGSVNTVARQKNRRIEIAAFPAR
jgi:outer membrane protein OmpA-like peptidoglycan-associated protein